VVGSLAFLWHENGCWHVKLTYGPAGSGATQEESFAALREVLYERRRSTNRRAPASKAGELIAGMIAAKTWWSTKDLDQSWAEEIERFGLDDCLPIAPHAFAALLDERCTRLKDRELRRYREFQRPFGHQEPRPVSGISDHPVGAWLRRHRILWVASELYDLPVTSHWTPGRFGIFAFDGHTLLPLEGSVENLQTLFQTEQPLLDDVAPARVAELVVEAVGRRGNAHHTLATFESLERMEDSGLCVLDRRELARISPLPAATLETSKDGWILRFATRFGELNMDDEVYEWRVEVSRRFEVQVQLDLLSSRIFSSRPFVIE
jgi:hypothetical protein